MQVVLAHVGLRVQIGDAAHDRHAHATLLHVEPIATVVEQAGTIALVRDIDPALREHLRAICRALDRSQRRLKGSPPTLHRRAKGSLQAAVAFVPVDVEAQVEAGHALGERDLLLHVRIAIAIRHTHRGLHGPIRDDLDRLGLAQRLDLVAQGDDPGGRLARHLGDGLQRVPAARKRLAVGELVKDADHVPGMPVNRDQQIAILQDDHVARFRDQQSACRCPAPARL